MYGPKSSISIYQNLQSVAQVRIAFIQERQDSPWRKFAKDQVFRKKIMLAYTQPQSSHVLHVTQSYTSPLQDTWAEVYKSVYVSTSMAVNLNMMTRS